MLDDDARPSPLPVLPTGTTPFVSSRTATSADARRNATTPPMPGPSAEGR